MSDNHPEPLPQAFGRYRVSKFIPGGNQRSRLYLCHDPQTKRDVAVKVITSSVLENSTERGRFELEARLLTQLEHPAIVPLYDYGLQGQQPYLVMRYIQAGSLADRLNGYPLPTGEALDMLESIASALNFAHTKNVIHRDIKPANILVDENHNCYLADFGISTFINQQGRLTTQSFIGTAIYASPEQSRGEKLTFSSDIYSLGMVAFQMLTGELPFDFSKDRSAGDIHYQHIHISPQKARQINPSLSREMESALADSLEKQPQKRPRTATEFISNLRKGLHAQNTSWPGKIPSTSDSLPFPGREEIWICAYCGYSFGGEKKNCPACGNEDLQSGGMYV